MTRIEIEGCDGSGKTTLASLCMVHLGIDRTATTLFDYKEEGEMVDFKWWFADDNLDNVVRSILNCACRRHAAIQNESVTVIERGVITIAAMISAHHLIRGFHPDLNSIIKTVFEAVGGESPGVRRFLLHKESWHKSDENKRFSDFERRKYRDYQKHLRACMDKFSDRVEHQKVISRSKPAAEIAEWIFRESDLTTKVSPPIEVVEFPLILLVGGPSESGKSTFTKQISELFPSARLKLGYFAKNFAFGSMELALEISRFCRWHREYQVLFFESLCGDELPNHLRSFFGPSVMSIYIDCPKEIRVQRLEKELQIPLVNAKKIVASKDAEKTRLGLMDYKNTADILVDSSSSESIMNVTDLIRKRVNA